jgi:hypothetical protein
MCAHTQAHYFFFLSPNSTHFKIMVFWDAMPWSMSQSAHGSIEKNLYHCQETNTSCPACSRYCTELTEIMVIAPGIQNYVEIA